MRLQTEAHFLTKYRIRLMCSHLTHVFLILGGRCSTWNYVGSHIQYVFTVSQNFEVRFFAVLHNASKIPCVNGAFESSYTENEYSLFLITN